MTLIAIPETDIDTAGQPVDVELPPAWLEAELADVHATARGPGRLVGRISRSSGTEIVVHGKVTAKVTLPCARCLDPAPVDVDTDLTLLLQQVTPTPAPGAKKRIPKRERAGDKDEAGEASRDAKKKGHKKDVEYEFTAGEADVDTYEGDTVVLDGFVREAILLEMPIFPLCSEACPGIRPRASSEAAESPRAAPIDPRLAPLGALRAKLAEAASKSKPAKTAPITSKKKSKKE